MSTDVCAGHECDHCDTCEAGRCCREDVLTDNLPEQGSMPMASGTLLGVLNVRDGDGALQCHICGVWKDKLGSHLKVHKISGAAYRSAFGLRAGERLSSDRDAAKHRGGWRGPGNRVPPSLTFEQRSEIQQRREKRFGDLSRMARERGRGEAERAKQSRARRSFDPGSECPECGTEFCSLTGRRYVEGDRVRSTKRVLCGQPECLSSARSRAAVIANRRRWSGRNGEK